LQQDGYTTTAKALALERQSNTGVGASFGGGGRVGSAGADGVRSVDGGSDELVKLVSEALEHRERGI